VCKLDKFHSLICVPMSVVNISQTRIKALVTVMLLAARNSVICIKTAEKFVSAVLGQITIVINVTLSRPQTKALDSTKDYDLCTQHSTASSSFQRPSSIFVLSSLFLLSLLLVI